MPIENIAYWKTQSGTTPLTNFDNTQVLSLPLPFSQDAIQFFVIFGRVVIQNLDGSPQNAGASLSTTTTDLDRVDVRIAADDSSPGAQTLSLMRVFHLDPASASNVVYLFCGTWNGVAQEATLIAISVDSSKHQT